MDASNARNTIKAQTATQKVLITRGKARDLRVLAGPGGAHRLHRGAHRLHRKAPSSSGSSRRGMGSSNQTRMMQTMFLCMCLESHTRHTSSEAQLCHTSRVLTASRKARQQATWWYTCQTLEAAPWIPCMRHIETLCQCTTDVTSVGHLSVRQVASVWVHVCGVMR